jgi:hypothetical protein
MSMERKLISNQKTIAGHILAVVEEAGGEGLRFCDIKRTMIAKGWVHDDNNISHNIHWLADNGHLTKTIKIVDSSHIPKKSTKENPDRLPNKIKLILFIISKKSETKDNGSP